MKRIETALPGVFFLEPPVHRDPRGFFVESYNQRVFEEAGLVRTWVQDNHSRSTRGVLRGLHFQIGRPQAKLIRVLQGEVYDVVVDVRKGSPTFGKWIGENLRAEDHRMIFVPEGFAHGFCVVSPVAEFFYKCSDFYSPADERGILWNDPDLRIPWPEAQHVLSDRDRKWKPLAEMSPKDLP